MKLSELAGLFVISEIPANKDAEFIGIQTDSRKVKPGDLFICIPGLVTDGHDYAYKAIKQGAAAIVAERHIESEVPVLYVKDSRFAMAVIANHFFDYPSKEMNIIGVTGTNGKTTTAYIIEQILRDNQWQTGLMGTIQMKIGSETYDTENTTQEALELQRNFRKMRDVGTAYCVMEVSSHAIALGRVKGCAFRTALFTNLTQDHLDFHKTMEHYRDTKGLFFSRLGNDYIPNFDKRKYAILNADDAASEHFAKMTSAEVVTYGIDNKADVKASDIQIAASGTTFLLSSFYGETPIQLKLIGKFNVYNALGAIAATLLEGVPLEQIKNSLEGMMIVPGRMEPVMEGQSFLVAVDYAHTPDGLENALSTIREFVVGRIITVFGCGGDRDKGKRPIMGKIAAQYSDYVYVTSDNPRTEDPELILKDIEPGLMEIGFPQSKYEMIADRGAAIKKAIEMASPNDVVLIAGKGHETYQDIGGVKNHFDDREVAREVIRGMKS
jgi:UDP-N-acetylmuramoyl-L-alanyl-D-glutamate--2,6-diaminopimelate ligase